MHGSLTIEQEMMRPVTVEDWVISELDSFDDRMRFGEFETAYGSLIVIQQFLICVPIKAKHEEIWTLYKKSVQYLEKRCKRIRWWKWRAKKEAGAAVEFLKYVGLGTYKKLMAEKCGAGTTVDAWNAHWQELNTDDLKLTEEMEQVWG